MKTLLVAVGVNGTNIINDTALKAFEDADMVSLDAPRDLTNEVKGYDLVIVGIDFMAPFKSLSELIPEGTISTTKLIVLTTLPFKFEGENRMATANAGAEEAKEMGHLVIVQNNEVLQHTPPFNEGSALLGLSNIPLQDTFKAITEKSDIAGELTADDVKAVVNQDWLANGLIEVYAK